LFSRNEPQNLVDEHENLQKPERLRLHPAARLSKVLGPGRNAGLQGEGAVKNSENLDGDRLGTEVHEPNAGLNLEKAEENPGKMEMNPEKTEKPPWKVVYRG